MLRAAIICSRHFVLSGSLAGYGGPASSVEPLSTLVGETFGLAEHHIYGSSRLGIQRYDQGVGEPVAPQQGALKSKWTYLNNASCTTFYNLSRPANRWSFGYDDLIAGAERVADNAGRNRQPNLSTTTTGSTDGSGRFTDGGLSNARRTLGWRHPDSY